MTRLFLATAATIYVVVFGAFLLLEHPGLGLGHFYYLAIALVALALGPVWGARLFSGPGRESAGKHFLRIRGGQMLILPARNNPHRSGVN